MPLDFIADALVALIQLIKKAIDGDREAIRKVSEILPERLQSELAQEAARAKAKKKFASSP